LNVSVILVLFQKFHRELCLLLLVLFGLACGHLIDTALQMNLRPGITIGYTTAGAVVTNAPKIAADDLNLILQNNVFDASNRSTAASMTLATDTAGSEGSSSVARADLKLLGTVVAVEHSQVLLEVNKELKFYHLGAKVPGDGTVEKIRRNQVEIRNRDQSLTTLTMHEQGPLATRGVSSSAEANADDGGDIRSVGENRWLISRNLVESVRDNLADQLRLAQMEPRAVDGKTDGFLVKRINSRSVLVKMGLQRGDVVKEVNNIKLDSPEKALQIFQQLREARQISVAVERNGQPMNFAYEIN